MGGGRIFDSVELMGVDLRHHYRVQLGEHKPFQYFANTANYLLQGAEYVFHDTHDSQAVLFAVLHYIKESLLMKTLLTQPYNDVYVP